MSLLFLYTLLHTFNICLQCSIIHFLNSRVSKLYGLPRTLVYGYLRLTTKIRNHNFSVSNGRRFNSLFSLFFVCNDVGFSIIESLFNISVYLLLTNTFFNIVLIVCFIRRISYTFLESNY